MYLPEIKQFITKDNPGFSTDPSLYPYRCFCNLLAKVCDLALEGNRGCKGHSPPIFGQILI